MAGALQTPSRAQPGLYTGGEMSRVGQAGGAGPSWVAQPWGTLASAKIELQVPFRVHSSDRETLPRPEDKWSVCLLSGGCLWLEHAPCAHQGWHWMDMHAHVYG